MREARVPSRGSAASCGTQKGSLSVPVPRGAGVCRCPCFCCRTQTFLTWSVLRSEVEILLCALVIGFNFGLSLIPTYMAVCWLSRPLSSCPLGLCISALAPYVLVSSGALTLFVFYLLICVRASSFDLPSSATPHVYYHGTKPL